MVDFTTIKEVISPKTLNKFTFALVVLWTVLGAILCGAFLELKINEPRYDFRCDGTGETRNIDYIRGECFHQYWIQNHKHGIPPYAFILLNVALIPIVTCIYSLCVKSTVYKLERRHQDEETEPRDKRRTLFIAYVCQLVVNIALETTFFALLETHLFFPENFPSNFSCTVKNLSVNCNTTRAGEKNVWITLAEVINGFFAFCAFVEIIWILSRARNSKKFMENPHFYFHHLESKAQEVRQNQPEATPLVVVESLNQTINTPHYAVPVHRKNNDTTEITVSSEHLKDAQAQMDFQSAIQTLKENCLQGTQQPSDLVQPFQRPNPGEGHVHDLTMDEIYVHVAIHEGRAHHHFAENLDRGKQLKEYPPDEKHCQFTKPEDILDKEHKNVLVVGRPGIGKTSFSTKMLRLWASGEAFNRDALVFNVVFLVKFRRFNDNPKLSLRDLLTRAETVECLDDSVWELVQNEPTKVLLIFDGLDEFSRKEDILAQEDYNNNVKEKMPVSVLYKKLAGGQLLRGASILTTTRPKAVEYVSRVKFARTVEIRGFTSKNVEDYVEKFCRDCTGAKEKIWEHIKSNTNLFSLCYIPVNCFLICHCLLQIFLSGSSAQLPTKITDIYQMTVKMVFFNHNREKWSLNKLETLKETHMYKRFENFPEELKEFFDRLGKIALKGIKEGRLLFESSEVRGLEDCGLLHKLPNLQPKRPLIDPPKSQFCFTHLTVQEFFAAKYLVDTKCKTKWKMERFVRKHINDDTWQVVLQFVAGSLEDSSSDIFITLLPKSTKGTTRMSSEMKRLTCWPAREKDKYQAVQVCKCLYEITDEQVLVLQNKIEKIKFDAVEFSHCSLAPSDVAAVLHFLENAEEVLDIDLSSNSLGDLGGNEVKKFIVNRERKLKCLNLGYNNLTSHAAKELGEALQHSNCKLESLDLSYNNVTDTAAKDLGEALKHSNCKLKSLDLSLINLTDNAAQDLGEALKHSNCKLESLDLSYNDLTDNAAKDLAEALKHSNCKLKSLGLSRNNLTDNAAKDLGEALKYSNCKLESLDLSYNDLTDNAAKDLGEALKHSNCKLESLDLSFNNFTEEAQQYLIDTGRQSNCKVHCLKRLKPVHI
ncbi:PREDICTED: NACHT, LRR and PYD domains-containing protein 14-like isoform X1 [Acropora digitifera]|uniref:NACHT, LRR and PYD domains-containing protein 14-like isoform X1 n=1 Tax=Acropora digitifera TaxID=70779 RepID=UPI00077A235E|nr:PREDICTED: NACHT, LRR and PYD domains-containing protein 14-like isoform X1 [Acropora digitifera]XP_015755119.1 PREDICTED: NACHT, LRR and PYD domains-containing protein 14-like isoform X1 [Acropora digitifera]